MKIKINKLVLRGYRFSFVIVKVKFLGNDYNGYWERSKFLSLKEKDFVVVEIFICYNWNYRW